MHTKSDTGLTGPGSGRVLSGTHPEAVRGFRRYRVSSLKKNPILPSKLLVGGDK